MSEPHRQSSCFSRYVDVLLRMMKLNVHGVIGNCILNKIYIALFISKGKSTHEFDAPVKSRSCRLTQYYATIIVVK